LAHVVGYFILVVGVFHLFCAVLLKDDQQTLNALRFTDSHENISAMVDIDENVASGYKKSNSNFYF